MPPTYPPLSLPAVLFANRGARAHAPENTLEAFRLALRLGAAGIRSTAWRSADGAVVLDASGAVGGRFRRRPISGSAAADLPDELVTLAGLYDEIGAGYELFLELPDPAALDPVLSAAGRERSAGPTVVVPPGSGRAGVVARPLRCSSSGAQHPDSRHGAGPGAPRRAAA